MQQPEVTRTEYGAEYVKAATENPVHGASDVTADVPEDVVETPSAESDAEPLEEEKHVVKTTRKASDKPKRKTVRTRKAK